MAKLRSCYPNAIADQPLWLASIATYWEHCREYPTAQVRGAFATAWRRYPDWFPTLGQFVAIIEGTNAERANEAWPEVLRLARQSSSEHSDPIAVKAIKAMGGGRRLGMLSDKDLGGWARREFVDRYIEIARKHEQENAAGTSGAKELPPSVRELIAEASRGGQ